MIKSSGFSLSDAVVGNSGAGKCMSVTEYSCIF